MAAKEFLSFAIIDATQAAFETAIENIEKGIPTKIFAIGKDPQQICIVSYADS